MTYFPDGAPFDNPYAKVPEPGTVAMGWLDAGEPFEQGEVPAAFRQALRALCRAKVNRTRGLHPCPFCDERAMKLGGVYVEDPAGERFVVGNGEIRVTGTSGTRYASPDMVIHYVEAHRYRPPDDYIQGAIESQAGEP